MATAERRTTTPRNELLAPKGTLIFRQGDAGDSMFIIERGRVRIVLHCEGQEAAVAVLHAGDFFGEMSLLCDAARSATAEALEDSTLLVVRRDVFAMMMQDDVDIVFRMLRAMGERLSGIDRRFWSQMQRQGRIRLLAEGLRRVGVVPTEAPVVIELDRLAAELGLDPSMVATIVGEVGARGAGTLENGRWRLDGSEHLHALIEQLRTYAEDATKA